MSETSRQEGQTGAAEQPSDGQAQGQAPPAAEPVAGEQGGERAEEQPPAGQAGSAVEAPAAEGAPAAGSGTKASSDEGAVEATAVREEPVREEPVQESTVQEDEPVGDDSAQDDAAPGVKTVARTGGGDRRQAIRRYWPFAVMALTTLVLAVGVFIALKSTDEPSSPQPAPQAAPKKTPPDQLEKFSDPQGGFSLSYPKTWRRIPVPPGASDLRLVLSTGTPDPASPQNPNPPGNDGMWVRVIPSDQVEKKYVEFADEIKTLTGDKACGTEGSPCLRQEQVTVAGMTGVRFLYITPDGTGQNSIHVQYFIRRDPQSKLYVIVFQAVPTTDLSGLAPTFDEVLDSFQAT